MRREITDIRRFGTPSYDEDEDEYEAKSWEAVTYKIHSSHGTAPAEPGRTDPLDLLNRFETTIDLTPVDKSAPTLRFHRDSLVAIAVKEIAYEIQSSPVDFTIESAKISDGDPF